jgi:DNA-binding MurR/RpiR family transcriptional regulator
MKMDLQNPVGFGQLISEHFAQLTKSEKRIANYLNQNHSARLRSRLDDLRQGGDLFEKVTVSEIDYLSQALQTVDRDALHRAATYMLKRNPIFVYGTGPSVSLVHSLNLRLTRFGKRVIPLTIAGRETLEPLLLMSIRHCRLFWIMLRKKTAR